MHLTGPIWAAGYAVYVALKAPPLDRVEIELDPSFQCHSLALVERLIFAIEIVDALQPIVEVIIHHFTGARDMDMFMPLFVPLGCVEIL